MTASVNSSTGVCGASGKAYYPDGRQTRIDFFSDGTSKLGEHVTVSKKGTFEWWQTIAGWLRASKKEQLHHLGNFNSYLENRGFKPKTLKSYLYMVQKFFSYLDEKQVEKITFGIIEDYNYEFFVSGRYSRSYQLQFINAISLYLEFSRGKKVNLKGLRKCV